jgi:hypothetical protein
MPGEILALAVQCITQELEDSSSIGLVMTDEAGELDLAISRKL